METQGQGPSSLLPVKSREHTGVGAPGEGAVCLRVTLASPRGRHDAASSVAAPRANVSVLGCVSLDLS